MRFGWIVVLLALGLGAVSACEGTTQKTRRDADQPDFPDRPPAGVDTGGSDEPVGEGMMAGHASPDGQHVNFWVRSSGNHALGIKRSGKHKAHADLDALPQEEVELDDAQYGRPVKVKGIRLGDLLDRYPQSHAHDMVLLHFHNKMVVPIALGGGGLDSLNALLAREILDPDSGAYTTDFPKIARQEGYYEDPNPIAFTGNKLIVPQTEFPDSGHGDTTSPIFPFAVSDSLVGLEFVQQRAYFAQFNAGGEDQVQDGMEVFFRRCQYCHSVSDVGAAYGWDFLKPVPIHTFKKADELTYHVKYAKMNAVQRGLRMPPQVDVEDAEIIALLKWIETLNKTKVKSYDP
jgi:hypothetical protein